MRSFGRVRWLKTHGVDEECFPGIYTGSIYEKERVSVIMSRNLVVNFAFETHREPSYWWVLFFERLSFYGFRFENPDVPKEGSYFIGSTTDEDEITSVDGKTLRRPFHVVWESVTQEKIRSLLTTFWHRDPVSTKDTTVALSFSWNQERCLLDFSLDFPGGDFAVLPLIRAEQYLSMIFCCVKEMLDLCDPISAEITWEDSSGYFTPWASLGDLSQSVIVSPHISPLRSLQRADQITVRESLANGKVLSYFQPVPVARENFDWEFVHFHSEGLSEV